MNELISIIIPVYNSEKYLDRALNSVKNQTYTDWELIIIDDKSIDNSLIKLNEFKNSNPDLNIRIIPFDKNQGVSVARNMGVKLARGRYVSFLDSDDHWEYDKLEKQIKFMKEKNIAFCLTDYILCYDNGRKKYVKTPEILTYDMLLKSTIIDTSSVLIDIYVINRKLLIMPNLPHEQDVVAWFQLLKSGYIAYSVPEPLTYYNKHRNSLSSNKFKNIPRLWNIYREYEGFGVLRTLYFFCFFAFNAIKKRL